MSAIRSRNTKPELALRKLLRAAGLTGYRLHRRDIPGSPDVAFMRWRVAVFVDGVFWHGHPDHWHPERTTSVYWRSKIANNIRRDRDADARLRDMGWTVVRLWDEDLKDDPRAALSRVVEALAAADHPVARRFA